MVSDDDDDDEDDDDDDDVYVYFFYLFIYSSLILFQGLSLLNAEIKLFMPTFYFLLMCSLLKNKRLPNK